MERFLGALSITLLLSGWAAVTQFQDTSDPVAQVVQAELSESHAAPSGSLLNRSTLISILNKALQLNQSQADRALLNRASHAHSSRQVSAVPLSGLSPFGEVYSDIHALYRHVPPYWKGQFYRDQGINTDAFSFFTQPYDTK